MGIANKVDLLVRACACMPGISRPLNPNPGASRMDVEISRQIKNQY